VIDCALELSKTYEITDVDTRPSRRAQTLSTKLQGTFVTGSIGHNRAATVEDLDVRLRQVVGHIRGELHSRFGKPQCAIMRAAAVCTTSSAKFTDAEMLQLLEQIFGISVKESEVEIFKNYTRRRPSTEENSDLGLAKVFALCDKDIFPSVDPQCVTVVAYRPADIL